MLVSEVFVFGLLYATLLNWHISVYYLVKFIYFCINSLYFMHLVLISSLVLSIWSVLLLSLCGFIPKIHFGRICTVRYDIIKRLINDPLFFFKSRHKYFPKLILKIIRISMVITATSNGRIFLCVFFIFMVWYGERPWFY